VANIELQSLVRWFYEEACSSSFLLIGVVSAGRPKSDLGSTVTYLIPRVSVCSKFASVFPWVGYVHTTCALKLEARVQAVQCLANQRTAEQSSC